MTKLTNQEIFDKALFGIRAQNYVKSEKIDICAYRGDGGLKCVVGHCIDDETANLWDIKDDSSISHIGKTDPTFLLFFDFEQIDFLERLQFVHDGMNDTGKLNPKVHNKELFETGMKELAEHFDLVYTEPTEQQL
jgi:hypothetical protein